MTILPKITLSDIKKGDELLNENNNLYDFMISEQPELTRMLTIFSRNFKNSEERSSFLSGASIVYLLLQCAIEREMKEAIKH